MSSPQTCASRPPVCHVLRTVYLLQIELGIKVLCIYVYKDYHSRGAYIFYPVFALGPRDILCFNIVTTTTNAKPRIAFWATLYVRNTTYGGRHQRYKIYALGTSRESKGTVTLSLRKPCTCEIPIYSMVRHGGFPKYLLPLPTLSSWSSVPLDSIKLNPVPQGERKQDTTRRGDMKWTCGMRVRRTKL